MIHHRVKQLLAIATISGISVVAQAILINGSFETGLPIPVPAHSLSYPLGSTDLTGWTVVQGGIDTVDGWQATDGIVVVDLNGSPGPGGLEQSFATVAGVEYNVTFDLAGNPSGQFDPLRTMRVTAAGQFQDFQFDVTGKTIANMGWESKQWSFTAVGNLTTIQFLSTDDDAPFEGAAIDNVVVEVVPEPTTVVLVATAFAGSLFALRRKN